MNRVLEDLHLTVSVLMSWPPSQPLPPSQFVTPEPRILEDLFLGPSSFLFRPQKHDNIFSLLRISNTVHNVSSYITEESIKNIRSVA